MGSLNPGTTYIYERVDNRIYAREMGQTKRRMVGWTDSNSVSMREYAAYSRREYASEMNSVLAMCEIDPAMRELLDQLFVLYNLKKNP
jgi:predicted RNA-binding Zn ribbon-like protein